MKNEAKFTKGPWSFVESKDFDGEVYFQVKSKESTLVGNEEYSEQAPYNKEDFYLIAAAPEMYAMLERLSPLLMELDEQTHPLIELDAVASNIDQLLAKARGEKA